MYSKPLYLRYRLDTPVHVNVVPVSVHKNLFHNYSLSKLGPIQANLGVNNSTNLTVIGLCVLHHSLQTLTFNIADLEMSALLSCVDTILLGLLQASGKPN